MKIEPRSAVRLLTAFLAAVTLLASCMTIQLDRMKDNELISAGVKLWNDGKPEDARPYWNKIRVPADRARYLASYAERDAIAADVEALLAMPVNPEGPYVEAFQALARRHAAWPRELNLSDAFKPSLRPQTVELVKNRVRAGRTDEARAFIETANAFLGPSSDYDAFLKEDEALAAIKDQEKSAEKLLVKARATAEFDDKIAAYETAIAAYGKVDASASQKIKDGNLPEESPIAVFQASIRKKRSAATVEMERALRQRQASFNERIGAIFARTPDDSQLGTMTPEGLLKFYEGIRTDIDAAYQELVAFAAKYPKVIDKDMVKEVEAEKANLDIRIVQINDEIRKMQEEAKRVAEEARKNKIIADEYASRGKVALPLMIGLFNPQPGTSAEAQKSRPAKIKGTMPGASDWWWGMISIAPGSKDDLVVTMADGKEVQVYADNPKKGAVAANMQNLVSMKDKVGKSWPVINAAKYLVNNRYYLQLKGSGAPAYSGEVVIYKSFIARMR